MPLDIKGFLLNSDGEPPVNLMEVRLMSEVSKRLPSNRTATPEEMYQAIVEVFGSDVSMRRIKKIIDTVLILNETKPEGTD